MSSKSYQHIDFKPPASVASAAARGLEYRQKAGGKGGLSTSQAKSEGIGSGVQRAVNLKNRDTMSPDTVRRMKAFFDRHEKNKTVSKGKEPWEDRGYVAWLLWGGDPGYAWAKKVVSQMDAADKKKKAAQRVVIAYLDKEAEKYDPEQLKKGIKVEREHGDVYDKAKEWLAEVGKEMPVSEEHFYEMIAKAHLKKLPDYYDRLEKMESEGESKEAMDFTGIVNLLTPDKTLDDRETARVIRLAIAAEHDAAQLYELIADASKDAKVKKLLQDIANEEKVHVGELQWLLKFFDKENDDLLTEGMDEANKEIGKPKRQ